MSNIKLDTVEKSERRDKMNIYFNFVFRPKMFFAYIMVNPKFLVPMLIILISNLYFSYSMLPFVSRQFQQSQVEISSGMEMFFKTFTMISSTMIGLMSFLLTCLIIYFVGRIFVKDLRLRYIVSGLAFQQIPKSLKLIFLAINVNHTGIVPEEKGLLTIMSTQSILVNSLLANIDILNCWSYFLMGILLHYLFKISLKKAYLLVLAIFFIEALFYGITSSGQLLPTIERR